MKKVLVVFWVDEAVFTKGALEMALKRTEKSLAEWNANNPREEHDVYEMAVAVYKRALATLQVAIETPYDESHVFKGG